MSSSTYILIIGLVASFLVNSVKCEDSELRRQTRKIASNRLRSIFERTGLGYNQVRSEDIINEMIEKLPNDQSVKAKNIMEKLNDAFDSLKIERQILDSIYIKKDSHRLDSSTISISQLLKYDRINEFTKKLDDSLYQESWPFSYVDDNNKVETCKSSKKLIGMFYEHLLKFETDKIDFEAYTTRTLPEELGLPADKVAEKNFYSAAHRRIATEFTTASRTLDVLDRKCKN